MRGGRIIKHLHTYRRSLFSSTFCTSTSSRKRFSFSTHHNTPSLALQLRNPRPCFLCLYPNQQQPISPIFHFRFLNTTSTQSNDQNDGSQENPLQYETTEDDEPVVWEEQEEVEPKAGDGGDGGGIVLQGVPWGERVLSIAREVLLQYGDDLEIYAFKTTHTGYVYVRLDKLSHKYGCPSIEELEDYNKEYKKRLEEVGARGEIPDDLGLEVSSPGLERILKVPDDLCRFQDMSMRVIYIEDAESNGLEKSGVFFLESIETGSENCVWKLADVKENRDPESKGRPLSRKRRDWRLKLPFKMHRRVTLYLDF